MAIWISHWLVSASRQLPGQEWRLGSSQRVDNRRIRSAPRSRAYIDSSWSLDNRRLNPVRKKILHHDCVPMLQTIFLLFIGNCTIRRLRHHLNFVDEENGLLVLRGDSCMGLGQALFVYKLHNSDL